METHREQIRAAQKMSVDAAREQWDKSFSRYMDLQKNIAALLPDEAPALPGMPFFGMSPRAFMEKMNEFQETIGRQARKQADSFFEFLQQERRTETAESAEDDGEEAPGGTAANSGSEND